MLISIILVILTGNLIQTAFKNMKNFLTHFTEKGWGMFQVNFDWTPTLYFPYIHSSVPLHSSFILKLTLLMEAK